MFKRKIYDRMLEWKKESDGRTALLIEGARRIGKSTVAEEFARNEYESYILIDFSIAPKATSELFEDISDISTALGKDEYVIEIVVPSASVDLQAPMNNPLHYVLTYWKDGTLYTLDPGRGKEEPRQKFIDGTTTRWCFCNSGIFLKK